MTAPENAGDAEALVEFKLVKRPVAFRVQAPDDTGWSWLYYRDEQNAATRGRWRGSNRATCSL